MPRDVEAMLSVSAGYAFGWLPVVIALVKYVVILVRIRAFCICTRITTGYYAPVLVVDTTEECRLFSGVCPESLKYERLSCLFPEHICLIPMLCR